MISRSDDIWKEWEYGNWIAFDFLIENVKPLYDRFPHRMWELLNLADRNSLTMISELRLIHFDSKTYDNPEKIERALRSIQSFHSDIYYCLQE
jgi:hypothetical protein